MSEEKSAEAVAGEGQQALAIAVAGLLGQIGCITLILIAAALAGGLWLDTQFNTRPLFTIILLLGTVPITLYLMVRMVLGGMARLQQTPEETQVDQSSNEEENLGRTT